MNYKNRLLIECTPTYSTNLQTGIQRVVKSIVNAATKLDDVDVLPVILVNRSLYRLPEEKIDTFNDQHRWNFVGYLLRIKFFIGIKDWLRRKFGSVFILLRNTYLKSRAQALLSDSLQSISIQPRDIILMLDTSWGRPELADLKKLANENEAKLVYILYDLIPLLYPQYCNPVHTAEFKSFISSYLLDKNTCGVIGISKAVIDDFHAYVQKEYSAMSLPNTRYFHLGVDKKGFNTGAVRSNVKNVFANDYLTLLVVSTIEPRKNHEYVLDVFDKLWASGKQVQLIIVGKIGWEVSELIKRIEQHPKLGSLLHVYHDLNDAELVYCYKNSTALISPSHTEGFGLPIIEALEHGLPVIASDIPVYREIGGDTVMYVKTDNTQNLYELILLILDKGVPEKYCPNTFSWLTWQDSATLLVEATVDLGAV